MKDPESTAPLVEVDVPEAPFQVTSIYIAGIHPETTRPKRYLVVLIAHYTRNMEAIPIPHQRAESCAQLYATQIVTWHIKGSKLISDKDLDFMSAFFKETCKITWIRWARTTSIECLRRKNTLIALHSPITLCDRSAHKPGRTSPLFHMANCAAPSTNTGYNPFFLLHGREMTLPGNENLKTKVPMTHRNIREQMQKLKASLKQA